MNPIPLIQSMVEIGLEAQIFLTQSLFGATEIKFLADRFDKLRTGGLFNSHTQNSFPPNKLRPPPLEFCFASQCFAKHQTTAGLKNETFFKDNVKVRAWLQTIVFIVRLAYISNRRQRTDGGEQIKEEIASSQSSSQ